MYALWVQQIRDPWSNFILFLFFEYRLLSASLQVNPNPTNPEIKQCNTYMYILIIWLHIFRLLFQLALISKIMGLTEMLSLSNLNLHKIYHKRAGSLTTVGKAGTLTWATLGFSSLDSTSICSSTFLPSIPGCLCLAQRWWGWWCSLLQSQRQIQAGWYLPS